MSDPTEIFGDVIYGCSRAQAIADGEHGRYTRK